MKSASQSDERVIEKARRTVAASGRLRWVMLIYATVFLGMCGYATFRSIQKIEILDSEQLKSGFVYGLSLAVVWITFGVMGGLCLGKFLAGFRGEFRMHELVLRYHDRLRDLGQLPEGGGADHGEGLAGSGRGR